MKYLLGKPIDLGSSRKYTATVSLDHYLDLWMTLREELGDNLSLRIWNLAGRLAHDLKEKHKRSAQ